MTFKDPVCGALVNVRSAVAAENYGRYAYYFCCEECHMRFVDDPASYVKRHPAPRPTLGVALSRAGEKRLSSPKPGPGIVTLGTD